MSTISGPVSDMLMTVKSREVQRGMLAEMRGDRPSAARHFLAAAHLELVLAADFDEIGDADLAVQSRLIAASCFWRAGDPLSARGLIENLLESHPERVVMIANHTSHLDSMVLGSALSCKWCDRVFPVAAGDVFFESTVKSLFSAQLINALPMWRKHCGPHALAELKDRLVTEPCGYILFPEGTRSRDGSLQHFKPGLGMIVAGTAVPVVPCAIAGASRAWPADSRLPRPRKLHMKIGPPLCFEALSNNRAGWEQVAQRGRGCGAAACRVG